MRANVIARGVIQVGERQSGHAHVARCRGLHGFAHDLGRGGNRDAVEFLAESADQDGMPEPTDGILRLPVRIEPLLESLPVVSLHLQCQWDQRARDRQLVGRTQEREVKK